MRRKGHSIRGAARALCVAALTASALLVAGDASAIIGMPLTPVSYAGVARRTTRRTIAASAAVSSAAVATVPPGTVAVVPSGCPLVGGVYHCGGATYAPAFNGPNVVYVQTQ